MSDEGFSMNKNKGEQSSRNIVNENHINSSNTEAKGSIGDVIFRFIEMQN